MLCFQPIYSFGSNYYLVAECSANNYGSKDKPIVAYVDFVKQIDKESAEIVAKMAAIAKTAAEAAEALKKQNEGGS
jgi:roadblock/LC7 domain-containing protein